MFKRKISFVTVSVENKSIFFRNLNPQRLRNRKENDLAPKASTATIIIYTISRVGIVHRVHAQLAARTRFLSTPKTLNQLFLGKYVGMCRFRWKERVQL